MTDETKAAMTRAYEIIEARIREVERAYRAKTTTAERKKTLADDDEKLVYVSNELARLIRHHGTTTTKETRP